MALSDSEAYAQQFLQRRFRLTLERLQPSRVDGQKTPDFSVSAGGRQRGVAEVKNLTDMSLPEGGTREVNGVGRFITHACGAAKQLAGSAYTKILVIVNDDVGIDRSDLVDAMRGYFATDGPYFITSAAMPEARARLKERRRELDLCFWIDRHMGWIPATDEPKCYAWQETEAGAAFCKAWFAHPAVVRFEPES